jgi:hypothetical protein
MVRRILVLGSLLCCGLVVVSFALFAVDQMSSASATQQRALSPGDAQPGAASPTAPQKQPRRFIDGAAHHLTAPFTEIVSSTNRWVQHGVPMMFALIVYGFGLGFVARYASGLS